jgi:hypothetical protein
VGLLLKVSTAVDVLIGPFVDDADGNTEENGLTIEDSDVLLSKNGGALTAKHDANDAVFDAIGYYTCPLDVTDTNTLGRLQLCCHMGGALTVYHEYNVVTANVYDTFCGADALDVELGSLNDITAAEVWNVALEGAITAKEQMNIQTAALAGKSSGGGTATIKFRDQGDSKDRITATVDANGNRTAITNDGA